MESDSGVWAVVISTSGEKYIGQVTMILREVVRDGHHTTEAEKVTEPNDITGYTKSQLCLKGALTFTETKIPMPNPQNPGQIFINRSMSVTPVGFALDPERCTLYVTAADIMPFDEMSVADKRSHEEAVQEGYKIAMEGRAKKAGIIPPGAHQAPPQGRQH